MNGEDVLGRGRTVYRCPVCDALLMPPETIITADGDEIYEGPGNHWCPACGWEDAEREDDDAADG